MLCVGIVCCMMLVCGFIWFCVVGMILYSIVIKNDCYFFEKEYDKIYLNNLVELESRLLVCKKYLGVA